MRTLYPHLLVVKVDSISSPSHLLTVHINNKVQVRNNDIHMKLDSNLRHPQLTHTINNVSDMKMDSDFGRPILRGVHTNDHCSNNNKFNNRKVDSKLGASILHNDFTTSKVHNNNNVDNMTVDSIN